VLSEEENGHLWHLRYPLTDGAVDGHSHLVVATTRPETMLGDSAVAIHPEDERYNKLIGKTVTLPLTGREIPIIADTLKSSTSLTTTQRSSTMRRKLIAVKIAMWPENRLLKTCNHSIC